MYLFSAACVDNVAWRGVWGLHTGMLGGLKSDVTWTLEMACAPKSTIELRGAAHSSGFMESVHMVTG